MSCFTLRVEAEENKFLLRIAFLQQFMFREYYDELELKVKKDSQSIAELKLFLSGQRKEWIIQKDGDRFGFSWNDKQKLIFICRVESSEKIIDNHDQALHEREQEPTLKELNIITDSLFQNKLN